MDSEAVAKLLFSFMNIEIDVQSEWFQDLWYAAKPRAALGFANWAQPKLRAVPLIKSNAYPREYACFVLVRI
jgi:hypothetical protein